MTNKPNPNGANGTTSDPREQKMWEIYVNNLAKGIDNAYKAAKEAGYEEATAKKITLHRWFTERKDKLRRKGMLSKAERNLEELLDMPVKTMNVQGKGDSAEMIVQTDPTLVRIKQDTSKFIASTLGKKDYSTRQENTGADGKELPVTNINITTMNEEEVNNKLTELLRNK